MHEAHFHDEEGGRETKNADAVPHTAPSGGPSEAVDSANADAQQDLRQQELARLMWLSLPENDQTAYYSDSEKDDSGLEEEPYPTYYSNRGNKLRAREGMRWIHRKKLGSWTESRMERELQERNDRRIHASQHASVESLLQAEMHLHGGSGGVLQKDLPAKKRRLHSSGPGPGRMRVWDPNEPADMVADDLSDEDAMALRAATLAPSLLLPVLSARGLLKSRLLKQNFRNPHISALSRTALDLRESEHVMFRALGHDARSAPNGIHGAAQGIQVQAADSTEAASAAYAHGDWPPAHRELSPTDITPALSEVNNLFITPEGLDVPAPDNGGDGATAEDGSGSVTISAEDQRDIAYASMECLNDLYSDSREFMERLDEVRGMLADVKRNRSHVWDMLRRWALWRDGEDSHASGAYRRASQKMQEHAQENVHRDNRDAREDVGTSLRDKDPS
ncbi:hypothetical protein MSPP1_001128 [Malassezia sp. CBS 17886]|nr:hypothetical protein MSPP1_001128 [Malassezia sp. CBS 17886]